MVTPANSVNPLNQKNNVDNNEELTISKELKVFEENKPVANNGSPSKKERNYIELTFLTLVTATSIAVVVGAAFLSPELTIIAGLVFAVASITLFCIIHVPARDHEISIKDLEALMPILDALHKIHQENISKWKEEIRELYDKLSRSEKIELKDQINKNQNKYPPEVNALVFELLNKDEI